MIPANFNQLYYFWAIAKAGSISSAARSLLLTQSNLSLQLKELERSLGRVLLGRGRGGVELTDHGRLAFAFCSRIFGEAQELLAALKDERPQASLLRVGVSLAVPRAAFTALWRAVRAVDPEASLRTFAAPPDELEIRLARHLLDLVLSDTDLSARAGRETIGRLVSSLPLSFVAAPRLAKSAGPFPACLERIPLLLRPPDDSIRKQADFFFYRRRLSPVIGAEVDDVDLLRELALRGQGAALMNECGVSRDLKARRLLKLNYKPLGIRENIWLVRLRHPAAPRLREILDRVMARFRYPA